MKKLLLLLPAIALAQTVPVPIPGTGACKITAVSAATPARITVENISYCGIQATDGADADTDPDNRIRIQGARSSNTATAAVMNINSWPANSTDEDGLCSIALNISGNQFDLYKCDGTTAITASSTWVAGGFIWRVVRVSVPSRPLMLDATVLAGIQSTATGTGWGDAARLPMQAVATAVDAYIGAGYINGSDPLMSITPRAALRWYAEGKPASSASKTAAIFGVNNINQYVGTFACDEVTGGNSGCGQAATPIMDYTSSHYGTNALLAASLMYDQLSGPEQTALRNWWLNDLPANQGGHNFLGVSLTKPQWKSNPGTVSVSGVNVTGDGSTNFLLYNVGDYMFVPPDNGGRNYRITAINSANSITLATSPDTVGAGSGYKVGPAWDSSQYGFLWFSKHFADTNLCGGNVFQGGAIFGCPDYPPAGGQGIGGLSNHNVMRIVNDLALGITFAPYDIRARWLMADAAGYFYHVTYPQMLAEYSGITNIATVGYAPARTNFSPNMGLGILKNATGLDYAHPQFVDVHAAWSLAATIPGTVKNLLSQGESSENDTLSLINRAPCLLVPLFYPTSTYAGACIADTPTHAVWTVTNFNRQDIFQSVGHLGIRPDVSPVTLTNPTFIFKSLHGLCTAQWNYFCYSFAHPTKIITKTAMVSRIGTPGSQTKSWYWDMVGFAGGDQQTQKVETGLYGNINGKIMLSPDGNGASRYGSAPENFGNVTFSGVSFKSAYPNVAQNVEERLAGNRYYSGGTVDLADHYMTSPGGSTRRSWIHAKRGTNDYVLEWFHLPASGTVAYHMNIEDDSCGTPSSTTCVTLNRAAGTWIHTKTGARLLSKVLGTATTSTENNSDTNGNYTNSRGKTFRVGVTGTNFGVLHRLTTNTSETLATATTLTSGSWSGVQVADGTSPAVMLVAPTNQTSLSGVSPTVSAYQLVAAGLSAGTYKVQAAGVDVSGCTAITVLSGEHTLECASVPSGALTISAVGAPLNIDTTSLPDGTVGTSYSQTLAGSGGSGTGYTWSLPSGSLPPGLSLNSATGEIGGTPSAAGTYTFTVGLADSASGSDTQPLSITIGAPAGGSAATGTLLRGVVCRGCTVK